MKTQKTAGSLASFIAGLILGMTFIATLRFGLEATNLPQPTRAMVALVGTLVASSLCGWLFKLINLNLVAPIAYGIGGIVAILLEAHGAQPVVHASYGILMGACALAIYKILGK